MVVEVPGYLPTAYTNQLTVHPDRENYIVLPTEMMIRGSRITHHAILVKSDLHINGMDPCMNVRVIIEKKYINETDNVKSV